MIKIVQQKDYKIGIEGDILITNYLATCIAVTIYDWKLKIGGLCHYLLPNNENFSLELSSNTFGNLNLGSMLYELYKKNVNPERLEAKIFGGASSIGMNSNDYYHIGKKNAEVAIDFLKKNQIPILAMEIGGDFYRNVEFNLSNGLVKISNKMGLDKIL
jgi:chemotaxis protein CheD